MSLGILTFRQKIELLAKMLIPYGFFCILMILELISIPVPYLGIIHLPLVFIAVFYWSLHKPELVPYWSMFCLGLIVDIFSGWFLGLNAMIYVVLRWFVTDQRRVLMGQSYPVVWVSFSLILIVANIIEWIVLCILNTTFLSFDAAIIKFMSGTAIFPVICYILFLVHKTLPSSETDIAVPGQ